ncbi:hypothetical protein DB347_06680 [Opitutaceae bacterium EW11]|nr:hypothetical protein DB347_06680 [Opitutaceae bacterium EW11]
MNTPQLITHSLRTLPRHRLRTAFIMLSSFVGAAALTFVLCVGEGARRKMLVTVRQIFGDSAIVVVAGGNQLMGGPRPDAARLTLDDIEDTVRGMPEIELWDPQQTMTVAAKHGNAAATVRLLGQSERSERVWSRSVSRGAYFDAMAVKRLDRVALIGETAARSLFGTGDPIGGEIQIEAVPFTVVGVLERFGTDIHGMDRDNEIVVPISTLMRRLANVDTIAAAKLLLRDARQGEQTAAEFRRRLRSRHALTSGQSDDFRLLTPVEVQRMMGKARSVLSLYLPLAAAVALVVGGIVAATLMLGAVSARIREIGLRRAVGAQPKDIAFQFLVETSVSVFGGGVAGIVGGLLAGQLVASRLQLTGAFSWNAVALALLMSAATALLSGVIPARRAARLLPAEALR